MRVVAIDPAPGKESTMYTAEDGFRQISGEAMRSTLEALDPPVLLCWDAPLTGPRNPEDAGRPGDFTQRRLDSFFARQETKFKTPKGISVLPYAGCPHWTISRSVLGLPRVGPYDTDFDRLPFLLFPDREGESRGAEVSRMARSCAVEIHPAVAAWLWCKDLPDLRRRSWKRGKGWKYKGGKKDPTLQGEMWTVVLDHCDEALKGSLPTPEDDDQFDAIIGYVLGVKWLRGDEDVVLLGDRENGSMLLPRTDGLCEAWAEFRDAGGS